MAQSIPDVAMTKTVIARVPYLNCVPFFHGLSLDESWEWKDVSPRQLGIEAEAGTITAGPMALGDFLRLQDRFERIGNLGVAVRGRCGSALLFSRKPIRQLDDATIAVTDETSTSALLLRLILEKRYALSPKSYLPAPRQPSGQAGQRGDPNLPALNVTGQAGDADAMLLIGDEALKLRAVNQQYPYEIDLAFEWWLWHHLPCVFAVWTVRKDCDAQEKQQLSRALQKQLAMNTRQLDALAQERAATLGIPVEDLRQYLANFLYRFGELEERAIKQFEQLVHGHHLL